MDNIFESIQLEKFQNKLSSVGRVYGICFDTNGKPITGIAGPEQDVKFLREILPEEFLSELSRQVAESEMEELIVEDTMYPWLKAAAICVNADPGRKYSVTWVFLAVLIDEIDRGDEMADQLSIHTTSKGFDKFLNLVLEVNKMMSVDRNSRDSAEAESIRSKNSEQEMQANVKRLAATTEIVQLLDRDDAIEIIMQDFLRIAGRYLNVSLGRVYQMHGARMKYVAGWDAYEIDSVLDPMAELDIAGLTISGKSFVTSISNVSDPKIREKMEAWNCKAIAAFPIMIHKQASMYVGFAEIKKDRIWSVEELRYINDAVRVLESIIARRIQKNSLASSYASLEAILDNVGCGIYVKDKETGDILFVNKFIRNYFPKELEEKVLDQIFASKVDAESESGSYELYYFEREKWYDYYYTPIKWVNGRDAVLCSLYEVTEKKKYQQRIEQQAYTDFLTGLFNRMCCERDLARFVDYAKNNDIQGTLLYLDLDDFKHINDGLGHQYGDVLLRSIAHSIKRIIGISETCYRMGGDEFVVIIPPENNHLVETIIQQIQAVFEKPWFLKDADYYCTMSMGVVSFPNDGESVEELIKKADLSMYDAKKSGKNRVARYSEQLNPMSSMRLNMEKNMRNATVAGCEEFEVFYQPIVDVSRPGSPCTGAEALVRWNSTEMGFVSPADFIPLAEYLGLINPIGNHILLKACEACKGWNDKGYENYKVNVNLSVVQLVQPDIAQIVKNALLITGLNPRNLTLEVTESLAIDDIHRMKEVLSDIRALGVRIALDDFGTGYSSLSHIRELPLDVIKVDQSFVKDLAEDEYSQAFVNMIGELAHTLGVSVCVEGIETEKQYKVLEKMRVRMIQGYYFDRPMKQQDFEEKYVK